MNPNHFWSIKKEIYAQVSCGQAKSEILSHFTERAFIIIIIIRVQTPKG